MSIKLRNSLPIRTGISIAITALVMNASLTFFFFKKEYSREIAISDTHISQLFNTVEKSAAVAAYLDNQELANEVTQGLNNNDIVASAELISLTGMHITSGNIHDKRSNQVITFPLSSPFITGENAGKIIIHPNQVLIEKNAWKLAFSQAITLAAHSFVVVIFVIFLVNIQLTRPLKQLIEALHRIDPGSDNRLECPKRNKDDEIGQLVLDTNRLLTATQSTIAGERRLRRYMETLERRFRLIFENASSGIALINSERKIILHNPSFEKLIGKEWLERLDEIAFEDLFTDRSIVCDAIKSVPYQLSPIYLDLQLTGADTSRWLHVLLSTVADEQGDQLIECILYDISERTQRELRIKLEAERDSLTQLLNRRAGEKRIDEALAYCKTQNTQAAIMLLDLNKFKPINDNYGHDAGDKVLISVSNRLNNALRKTDTVIRWGGDEFLILIQQGHEILYPDFVCKKVLASIRQPIDIGHRSVQVGASIGVALVHKHGNDKEQLIELADQAMYKIKQQGRDGFCIASVE